MSVYFYELHEGDGDVFADLMLARDEEMDAEEFFRTVQEIREQVIESHEHDTLIEAIADELERNHGFIHVSDERLTAAVNVSRDPDETFLADLEGTAAGGDDDDDDDDPEGSPSDFRSIVADFSGSRPPRPH
ncbi:MAG: hypothetical protein ACYDAK_08290 [Candidatus Limnocylindrales bacterium]